MKIELPDINEIVELILPQKSTFNKEKKSILEWVLEHRKNIKKNNELINRNENKKRILILNILLNDLLMRAMKGERGAKIRKSLDKFLNNEDDLNLENYNRIMADCQYRFPKDGHQVITDVVHYFKDKLNWEWEQYFTMVEKNCNDNFITDPLIKIKHIKFKVRDLALSNFNEHYIANDLHIVRVSTRIGLLAYGFDLLNDPRLEMGNNPQNEKNYLFLHKLFIKLSEHTNGRYSLADFDRIFWHFGRTICKSIPQCHKCPIKDICLTGKEIE
jgi:hypothetical protein